MIKILFEGVHTNHQFPGYYTIDPLTSSVTLIQQGQGGKNILVDTGTPAFRQKLFSELLKENLKPEDIHYVLNTHFHLDHCGNDAFFPNAEVIIGRSRLDYKTGAATIFEDLSLAKFPYGIELLPTPGHTLDHWSYVYREGGVTYVFAGDAVREDIIRGRKYPHVHDLEKWLESMKKIFSIADIIIPGHGRVIEGAVKTELRKLVEETGFQKKWAERAKKLGS